MIGSVIIILAFLSLVVLLSPVKICVNSAREREEIDGFFSLGWIIFLLRYTFKNEGAEILVLGRRIVRLPKKEKSPGFNEKIKESRPRNKSDRMPQKMPHSGQILSLSRPTVGLFKDILYSFKLKNLNVNIRFGLEDPADTGIMFGFLHSIIGIIRKSHNIRWSVDFTKPVLEWDLKAEIAITPIQIVLPVTRFITNKQVLRSGLRIIRN
ncbi:MAG: DUF2953 domain-containing protein [Candidatus Methanoperedens sp.]|nr:DUF2953 domain-containing protein [Candidatus Methanoperedens sp.]